MVKLGNKINDSEKNIMILETTEGIIKVKLEPERAPVTVENTRTYADEGFYDGMIFHRVIDNFVAQTGGYLQGPDYQLHNHPPIKNESSNGLKNERSTLAMARELEPDTAASQFYINLADNTMLDYPKPDGHGYAVFGKVIEGIDVVDIIAKCPTHSVKYEGEIKEADVEEYMENVPVKDLVIINAYCV